MYIRVLGPLTIHHGAVEVNPTARKPSTVLALLLLNQRRVVPVSELIDELWKDAPPKTARAALQVYVLNLRRMLAQAVGHSTDEVAETVLQTVQNGYRFMVEPGRLDLEVYHRLRRSGIDAMNTGDLPAAAQYFRQALRLWRGSPVDDVEPGIRIRAEIAALEQSRMMMQDYRIELELRLGMHRDILSELVVLISRNRFHENLHAQYMLALYRSGYRIRALEAYHQLRHDMLTEFGLEPSPKLKAFHQALLTVDSALDDVEVVPLPVRPATDLPDLPVLASSF